MCAFNVRCWLSSRSSSASLLLASSWLNVGLYTLELVLCWRYFQRPNRPFVYKLGVGALVFFDTAGTLTICINLVFVLLHLGGDQVALLSPTSVTIFMTYCSAAVEQAILCHLYLSLTKNKLVTVGLGLLILTHMGLGFSSGALILVLDSELTAALDTTTAASVTCAATDLCIAICLASKAWKLLSPTDVIPQRDSFVRRFLLLCVSAGLIVALNTLIMMGLLLKHSAAFSFFFSCQGRVYSLTLLTNFLVGVYFHRDTSTASSITVTNPRRDYTSNLTSALFDVIEGYETATTSNHPPRRGNAESKPLPTKTSPPVPYDYNLASEWMQLERRPPTHSAP
ncbi:hypothetical protein C8F04DRAFT_1117818 [Mycena alexandri]|uniref:Transmembrane protein n=1 Tax=Mycena alexandri TaxID=1745969 RepID=A0AAD6X1L6_9AGAR|nr:hypothetical protein C8F04DRAFT_1117818 [Mycena alexandri]